MFSVVQWVRAGVGASFIHVQLSRCQEFCQASHCSVNVVPAKRSVSISLVKHCCQATGGTERARQRKGWRGGGKGGRRSASLHPFIIKQTWPLTKKRVHEKSSTGESKRAQRLRMNVMWRRDGNGGEGCWGVMGGRGQCTCEQSRKVCAVHHVQTGRQGCLESLFLPRYRRSPDRLLHQRSVGAPGRLLSRCDKHTCHYTSFELSVYFIGLNIQHISGI